ncbi:MAG: lysylphosphatidylglycerol synthase transmembrane domain-containing protein [Trichodesmium sp. St15_bin1_1]|nr:flippase-like domain-containing protein [Trichodesmium sp. MAG_R02]MDE5084809.1 lysylphosphatidylglycerol synthase transmembrane domain-containing protein [Trichodesmium sp. St18_bin1]MDE5089679.1 lysylphosphatidylglycerol synthase transmembrane domain-containing protein [Trichodesmium sp. St16_bin2-tuft]MDE5113464.1 lysylphosphatidylglycerol synthase transmembrane domain-containing protein [Trichodesmium sp. St15_bin1_1]MDE5119747.1 lysylphosphatidylglycerol synthase transmembrane domain-co
MKRLISLIISLLILIVIYRKIDFTGLIKVFQNSHHIWMIISVSMIIPLTILTAWRLQQLMPKKGKKSSSYLNFGEANQLILGASVLNMILPSKMGDIVKAYFMKQRGNLKGTLSLSIVIFEKACDLVSLLIWCVFGLIVYPEKDLLFWIMTTGVTSGLIICLLLLSSRKFARIFFHIARKFTPKKISSKIDDLENSWIEMHKYFWHDKQQLTKIAVTSIFIWFGHLSQIWFFTLALNASAPFIQSLALSSLAILAGLLPLTFAGVGTRDAAFIMFYQPYFSQEVGAALGLLCTSRYVLPAIAGLPFFGKYLIEMNKMKNLRKSQ